MLNSLIKLGEHILSKYGNEYLIIENTKPNPNKAHHYNLEIIFNCDIKEIIVDINNINPFLEKRSNIELKNVKILPGNNKKVYVTVPFGKVDKLKDALLPNENTRSLSFINFIVTELHEFQDSEFGKALKCIETLNEQAETLTVQNITQKLALANNEEIILMYASVIFSGIGITEPKELFKLNGYKEIIERKFFTPQGKKSLCYASGKTKDNVSAAKFEQRYNLNKIFVETTINYINNFDKKRAKNNYQIDFQTRLYLEAASKYLLGNLTTSIAGVKAVVVPTFLSKSQIDFDDIISIKIQRKTDIAFNFYDFNQDVIQQIDDEIEDEIFWLNFLTFQTEGGKSFKIINNIKDVPFFRFVRIVNTLIKTGEKLKKYSKNVKNFNLYSLFKVIPVTKGSVNNALILIQDILENRKVNALTFFKFFAELTRIYYYGRYRAYKNISQKDNFDFAIKDAIISYFVIFKTLLELDLLENHNFNYKRENKMEAKTNENFGEKIEEFFETMNYSDEQKALFYLGRMLNTIAYAQTQKGHGTKPILNKINFNGMDKNEILRLHNDLFEKARQYGIVDKVEFDNSKFTKLFNVNTWKFKPEETLFFILTGYTFGLTTKSKTEDETKENNNNEKEQSLFEEE